MPRAERKGGGRQNVQHPGFEDEAGQLRPGKPTSNTQPSISNSRTDSESGPKVAAASCRCAVSISGRDAAATSFSSREEFRHGASESAFGLPENPGKGSFLEFRLPPFLQDAAFAAALGVECVEDGTDLREELLLRVRLGDKAAQAPREHAPEALLLGEPAAQHDGRLGIDL